MAARGGLAGARLFSHAFEDDHVGVGRHADREDDSRDARQRQRDRDEHDHRVQQDRVDDQGERGDDAEEAVVGDQEEHHQDQADDPGDQALAQRLLAQRRRDLLLADHLQLDRQRARVDLLGQGVGLALAEVAVDLGAVVAVDAGRVLVVVHRRVGDDPAVEDDREVLQLALELAVGGQLARDVGELVLAVAGELQGDDAVAAAEAAGLDGRARLGDVGAGQARVVLEDVPGLLGAGVARLELLGLLVGEEEAARHLQHLDAGRDRVVREAVAQRRHVLGRRDHQLLVAEGVEGRLAARLLGRRVGGELDRLVEVGLAPPGSRRCARS